MERPPDQHIDQEELGILVPWSSDADRARRNSAGTLRDLHRHLAKCSDCRKQLMRYRQVVDRLSNAPSSGIAATGPGCPADVDWNEVVAGLWPEIKAQQLIRHAAMCDHCGPMLRAATRKQGTDPGQENEAANRKLRAHPRAAWRLFAWLAPVCAAMLAFGIWIGVPFSSAMSGTRYAEFAVRTHTRHARGHLALDVRSNSQQTVNGWLKQNAQFPIALPASSGMPDGNRPFQLEGASLVQLGGKRAVFVAYQMDSRPVSLMIAPYPAAVAAGGVEARFKKVTFHYRMVEGFKVVTWSQHGLTYALVSQEGTGTQKSCMVCHSAMHDRDLGPTPTPLDVEKHAVRSYLQ